MKTNEFITLVDDLGLNVHVSNFSGSLVVSNENNNTMITVSQSDIGAIDSNYTGTGRVTNINTKLTLLNYAYQLASTPIEEREDVENFMFKVPDCVAEIRGRYLNINTRTDSVVFHSRNETNGFKTQFTVEDVESYSDDIQKVFSMCEKINVEES